MTLPEPLVPPEVDLRNFAYMPLDVLRLRDSDLATLATGEEFRAAVMLWCAAWHQSPAASLPDDDRLLARLSGAGPIWKKVKKAALRGFVKCSDGRLYHHIIAGKALEAWEKKVSQRERTAAATAARKARRDAEQERRHDERNVERDVVRDDERNVERDVVRDPHQGNRIEGNGIERRSDPNPHPDVWPDPRDPPTQGERAWGPVEAAIQLRQAGVTAHPGHPTLIAACSAGLTAGELAAVIDAYPNKPLGYLLSAVTSGRGKAAQRKPVLRAVDFGAIDYSQGVNPDGSF